MTWWKTEGGGVKYGSVCSGIEAASVAWHPLGWSPVFFSEIEPFPCAVLAHHYPDTPNLGDMTAIARRVLAGEVESPDVLCGGTPCQAFSVAGLRESLADERGNLTLKFVELADAVDHVRAMRGEQPTIILWENVPGVLSTKDNAFGCFLAGLAGEDEPLQPPGGKWSNAGAVYGPARAIAWRTLDAQYFGLAQRRRRVFVVASARAGFDPAQVLFEWDGVRRDTAPSREAGKDVTGTLEASLGRSRGAGTPVSGVITMAHGQAGAEIGYDRGPTLTCNHEAPIAAYGIRTANTSSNGWGIQEEVTHTLDTVQGLAIAFHPTQDPISSTDGTTHAMGCGISQGQASVAVAIDYEYNAHGLDEATGPLLKGSPTGGGHPLPAVMSAMQVRRLTPVECARLQGFPDTYLDIPYRNKPAADGPKYKALGNSMAVPVMRWIGERIQVVSEIKVARVEHGERERMARA